MPPRRACLGGRDDSALRSCPPERGSPPSLLGGSNDCSLPGRSTGVTPRGAKSWLPPRQARRGAGGAVACRSAESWLPPRQARWRPASTITDEFAKRCTRGSARRLSAMQKGRLPFIPLRLGFTGNPSYSRSGSTSKCSPNVTGRLMASARRWRYSCREISTAPRRAVWSVSIWMSRSR